MIGRAAPTARATSGQADACNRDHTPRAGLGYDGRGDTT